MVVHRGIGVACRALGRGGCRLAGFRRVAVGRQIGCLVVRGLVGDSSSVVGLGSHVEVEHNLEDTGVEHVLVGLGRASARTLDVAGAGGTDAVHYLDMPIREHIHRVGLAYLVIRQIRLVVHSEVHRILGLL